MRRKTRTGKRKPNNEGFTLFELLVAALIIAVLLIPFMSGFLTSARTNSRAKRVLEATTAGQNVLEELKAKSVADFIKDADSVTYRYRDKNGDEIGVNSVTDIDGEMTSIICKKTTDPVNGHMFKVTVTLNRQGKAGTGYNSSLWAQPASLSEANNAFLLIKKDSEVRAAEEIVKQFPVDLPDDNNGGTQSSSFQTFDEKVEEVRRSDKLKRKITVTVGKDQDADYTVVKATVLYTYEKDSKTYEYLAMDDQEIFNNGTNKNNTLKNVFVCYTPMYYHPPMTKPTETLVFNNTGDDSVGLYLVKQQPAAACPISVKIEAAGKVTTNLKYEGGTNDELHLYKGKDSNEKLLSKDDAAKAGLDVSAGEDDGLKRGQASDRIYDVTVKVYKENAGRDEDELLTEMEGTKTE